MLRYMDIDNGRGTVTRLHDTPTRALARVDGLVGVTRPRHDQRKRPSAHGSIRRGRFMGERSIELEGEVWGSSPAHALAEMDVVQSALMDALEGEGCLLKWQRGADGPELQAGVRLADRVRSTLAGSTAMLRYEAALVAPDPRFYSQAVYTARSAAYGDDGGGNTFPATYPQTFQPGSSGQAVVTNGGTSPTPPVFALHGELTNPRIRLLPDGPEVCLTGTIGRGSVLTLDVAKRTVLLNGTANRLSMIDYRNTEWFDLPVGASTVRLLADSGDTDAYMTVTYRDAYSG